MYSQLIYVAVFLVVLACLPLLTKWLVRRNILGSKTTQGASKLVSVVAVGPSQRVVTVEVGPEHDRAWLVLGVTAQQITFLHHYPFAKVVGQAAIAEADDVPNSVVLQT